MLRAFVMEYPGNWDKNLSWAKFLYNNSYQESLKMTPFEALYGRQCRTPLNWIESGEKAIFGLDIIVEAEATVRRIQENLKAAKFCAVWTIKLSRRFFRINWSRIGSHSQRRNCS
jgi:hypothetical protein